MSNRFLFPSFWGTNNRGRLINIYEDTGENSVIWELHHGNRNVSAFYQTQVFVHLKKMMQSEQFNMRKKHLLTVIMQTGSIWLKME